DAISVETTRTRETDARYIVPEWVDVSDRWKYQLGQLLRVILTGVPDYTLPHPRPSKERSSVQYVPVTSAWVRRRYGLFNGRNAFGPPWLPISPWFASLLSRLLEWPGFARFESELHLPDRFSKQELESAIG